MTETSKENEMTEEKVEALGKIIRDAGISGVTSDRVGPFDRARADAVIAAGWVSPEEHAEYVAMEGRFAELLCDLTDGLLSKTNYDVRAMVQQVEQTFEKFAPDPRRPAGGAVHVTRVIKARALENEKHVGLLVSWKDLPPARLQGVTTSLRFAYLFFGFGNAPSISADLEDDITIHDEPEEGP